MLKSYILITLRNMVNNKLFLAINISGLSIAIGCCMVAFYLHNFNDSFDKLHVQHASIYRVSSIREFQNKLSRYGHSPMALGNAIKENIKEIDQVVRYSSSSVNLRIGSSLFNDPIVYTDPSFFDVFTFESKHGNLSIKDKTSLVISETLAYKYFGSENVIGNSITQLLDSGHTREFVVTGVFKKQPNNTSFNQQAYTHFDNQFEGNPDFAQNNWVNRVALYLLIKDPTRVASIEKQLQVYTRNNNEVREDFIIQEFDLDPFTDLAKNDSYQNVRGVQMNSAAHISAILGTAIMGIFALLIACFNLTNTAIAISSKRLKEIGLRKVMGSSPNHIMIQHIGETFIICTIALFGGIFIGHYWLIPAFNSLWSFWSFDPDFFSNPNFFIYVIGVLLLTSLLAGAYPAIYISRFQPVNILSGKVKFGGTNGFTKTLLTLQLVISLIAIVCSIAFVDNAKYQKNIDLGFNKKEVVYTAVRNSDEYTALRNRLLQNPSILSIGGAHHQINASYFSDPIKHENQETEVDILDVGDHYLQTVGLTLLAGRDFITDSETDKRESVLITENLASYFGWDNPLGKELIWMDTNRYFVIGVVKNIIHKGLMNRMDPIILRYSGSENIRYCIASAPTDQIASVKLDIETVAKELFPDRISEVKYMDELVVRSNEINSSILSMFIFLGIVTLLLSATGFFTLVSLNIIKRLKEIGVRKILGASIQNLIKVINKEFIIILLIASGLGGYAGASLASLLMDSIWEHFQQTTLMTIIFSILVMIITSGLAIGYKIYSTIRLNPTDVIRSA